MTDSPAPTEIPIWMYADSVTKARSDVRGLVMTAELGIYFAELSHDGECWRWRLAFIGGCDMPEPMVDGAHGLFCGDEAGAKARAKAMADMLNARIEP